jgi:23S rRNA (guanosine2251-2'-O)-methyltransferase
MRKLKLDELGRLSVPEFKLAEKAPLVVVLDSIRSKNNVGSVFRTGDAFRIAHLYLCGYTPAPPDRDIAKTSLGAEESVAWTHVQDAVALARQLKAEGYVLLSVEQADRSTPLPAFKPEAGKRYAVVFGNEVGGVDQAIVDLSDAVLEIPQYGTKHSLNIAVAAGIVLYALATEIQGAQ